MFALRRKISLDCRMYLLPSPALLPFPPPTSPRLPVIDEPFVDACEVSRVCFRLQFLSLSLSLFLFLPRLLPLASAINPLRSLAKCCVFAGGKRGGGEGGEANSIGKTA